LILPTSPANHDYSDQSFTSNLSSVMAFYAYVIVGMDYDSFSRFGGTPYFTAAQNVVNLAQSSSIRAGKLLTATLNRYWLCENLNNKLYAPLRSFVYDYHRSALDIMADNSGKGLKLLKRCCLPHPIDRTRIGDMYPVVFLYRQKR